MTYEPAAVIKLFAPTTFPILQPKSMVEVGGTDDWRKYPRDYGPVEVVLADLKVRVQFEAFGASVVQVPFRVPKRRLVMILGRLEAITDHVTDDPDCH